MTSSNTLKCVVSEDGNIQAKNVYEVLIEIIRACDDERPQEIEKRIRDMAKDIYEQKKEVAIPPKDKSLGILAKDL